MQATRVAIRPCMLLSRQLLNQSTTVHHSSRSRAPKPSSCSTSSSSTRSTSSRRPVLGALALTAVPGVAAAPTPFAGVMSHSSGAAAATAAGAAAGPLSSSGGSVPEVLVVYVTVPSKEVGVSLSRTLVQEHLVACVNIIPGLTSVYWWKDEVQEDPELLLVMKTRPQLMDSLTARVKALHPYEEPEVVALPVVAGSTSYLGWVHDSTVAAVGPQPPGPAQ